MATTPVNLDTYKLRIANLALRKLGVKPITSFYDSTDSSTDQSKEARVVTEVYDDIRDEVLCQHIWGFAQKRVALTESADAADWVTATAYSAGDFINKTASAWVTGTAYMVGQYVLEDSVTYRCLVAHTSGTFADDLSDVYWLAVDNAIYRCLLPHTSGTFADDLTAGYWTAHVVVDIGDGVTFAYQKPSDFLKMNFTNNINSIVKIEEGGILSDASDLAIIYTYQNDNPLTYFPLFKSAFATRLAAEVGFNFTESVSKAGQLMELYQKKDLPEAMAQDSQQGSPLQAIQDEWLNGRETGGMGGQQANRQTWHPSW